VIERVGSG